ASWSAASWSPTTTRQARSRSTTRSWRPGSPICGPWSPTTSPTPTPSWPPGRPFTSCPAPEWSSAGGGTGAPPRPIRRPGRGARGRGRRAGRAAEAVGNTEDMKEWADRLDDYRQSRHDRRMELLALPADLIPVALRLGLGCAAVLGLIGVALAAADKDSSEIV